MSAAVCAIDGDAIAGSERHLLRARVRATPRRYERCYPVHQI